MSFLDVYREEEIKAAEKRAEDLENEVRTKANVEKLVEAGLIEAIGNTTGRKTYYV